MSPTPAERINQSGRTEDRPNFMHRWDLAVQADDKRRHKRVSPKCEVWLIDAQGETVLRCRSSNVSEGGVHVILPLNAGLALGQRYEVRLVWFGALKEQTQVSTEAHQATVVRTESLMCEDGVKLGAGLRFDPPSRFPGPSC